MEHRGKPPGERGLSWWSGAKQFRSADHSARAPFAPRAAFAILDALESNLPSPQQPLFAPPVAHHEEYHKPGQEPDADDDGRPVVRRGWERMDGLVSDPEESEGAQ